jgi:hypothetical protein
VCVCFTPFTQTLQMLTDANAMFNFKLKKRICFRSVSTLNLQKKKNNNK